MLVSKIGPKLKPYILAAGLAVGTVSVALPMQNDRFDKFSDKEMMSDGYGVREKGWGLSWMDLIQWFPLLGLYGVVKIANYLERKELEEEEREKAADKNKQV